MDGDAGAMSSLARKYAASDSVTVRHAIVTPANIKAICADVPEEPDVMSIDIDGHHVGSPACSTFIDLDAQ